MDVSMDGTESFVIGVDYGTLSGRAVVVRVRDGKELGSGVFAYPHAVVTDELPEDTAGTAGVRLPGEWALQVPNDYRDVLGDLLTKRFGLADLGPIFPRYRYKPMGVAV